MMFLAFVMFSVFIVGLAQEEFFQLLLKAKKVKKSFQE